MKKGSLQINGNKWYHIKWYIIIQLQITIGSDKIYAIMQTGSKQASMDQTATYHGTSIFVQTRVSF